MAGLSGESLSSAGKTFFNTYMVLRDDRRQQEREKKEEEARQYYMRLAESQNQAMQASQARAAELHPFQVREAQARTQSAEMELKDLTERRRYIEQLTGMSPGEYAALTEDEKYQLQMDTAKLGLEAATLEINQRQQEMGFTQERQGWAREEAEASRAERPLRQDVLASQAKTAESQARMQQLDEMVKGFHSVPDQQLQEQINKDMALYKFYQENGRRDAMGGISYDSFQEKAMRELETRIFAMDQTIQERSGILSKNGIQLDLGQTPETPAPAPGAPPTRTPGPAKARLAAEEQARKETQNKQLRDAGKAPRLYNWLVLNPRGGGHILKGTDDPKVYEEAMQSPDTVEDIPPEEVDPRDYGLPLGTTKNRWVGTQRTMVGGLGM